MILATTSSSICKMLLPTTVLSEIFLLAIATLKFFGAIAMINLILDIKFYQRPCLPNRPSWNWPPGYSSEFHARASRRADHWKKASESPSAKAYLANATSQAIIKEARKRVARGCRARAGAFAAQRSRLVVRKRIAIYVFTTLMLNAGTGRYIRPSCFLPGCLHKTEPRSHCTISAFSHQNHLNIEHSSSQRPLKWMG